MSHQVLPPRAITGSPVEHTLNLLQERLFHAEGETNKLAKQLENYGFRRISAEKPEAEYGGRSDRQHNVHPQNYDKVITRLCKMESLITSLTAGMDSLEAEKSSTVNQLMQEKRQILENYGKELKQTRDELDKSKQTISAHVEAKSQLEKQIAKLKKDTIKRVETQKLLAEKLKEKDTELHAFKSKFAEVSKELSNQQSCRRKIEDSHSSLLLKITEMEADVESERANVENLNQKCISLTEDALLARGEFEKEFSCRLQFQDMMAVHEEEIKAANENLQKYEDDNNLLRKTLTELEGSLKTRSADNVKFKNALDSTSIENDNLKQALKKAAIDNQALVKRTKEALSREQCKVDQAIQQQSKILDSAKDSLLGELDKQQKHSQKLESENLELKDNINELTSKNGELDFKLKILEQTKANEISRLQNVVASAEKVKDELAKQLKQKEKELVEMNNSWMKERSSLMQKYEDIAHSLRCTEEHCEKLDREKNEISEKLSWVNVKQHSQENIEIKFSEMVSEKSKLAYEKGVMQSKISNLESQLNDLRSLEDEKQVLQSRVESIGNQHTELKRTCTKVDTDLQYKSSELQRLATELEICQANLLSTEKSLSQATSAYNEAVEQTENLLKQAESAHNKHELEISSYQSRLVFLEKERENITATFETMMATNNNFQEELERVQGNMGKKDAEIEELYRDRENHAYIVNDLKEELTGLTSKLDQLDNYKNREIAKLKEQLQIEISEKYKIQIVCEKLRQEGKNMKTVLKKLTEDYKCKDNELKDYINAKHTDLEKVKKEHGDHIECIKEEHKKELSNLKRQHHDLRMLSTKKDKYGDASKMILKTLGEQLKGLEEDKKMYVEKNGKQSKLLDEFMSQIVDLQTELSNIIQSQSETDLKLKEKDKLITTEKRKRHDIEEKYKVLLKGKVEREVLKEKQVNDSSGVSVQHLDSLNNSMEQLLSEQKHVTQKMIDDHEQSTKMKSMKRSKKVSKENHEK